MKTLNSVLALGLIALVPTLSFAEKYECHVVGNSDFEEYTLRIDFNRHNLQESKTSLFDNDSWVDAPFRTVLRSYPAQFVFGVEGELGYTAVVREDKRGILKSAVVSFDETEGQEVSISMKCVRSR